jgi:HEAT repeat protein
VLATILSLWVGAASSSSAAATNDENQLIQVLQSGTSLTEKDAVCARLKRIGTAKSIPALARLLADEQLSHSARYALESMPYPAAGRALIEALDQTTGPVKIGIISSLGYRRETKAVPALAKLLRPHEAGMPAQQSAAGDKSVVIAAATALGQIGGPRALGILQAATFKRPAATVSDAGDAKGEIQRAEVDALLRCANLLLSSGASTMARTVFEHLFQTEREDYVRQAAYRGLVLASGKHALPMMLEAIVGPPGPTQTAALQLVHEFKSAEATKAFVDALPKVSIPVQIALIGGLSQCDDPAAAPAIATFAGSSSPHVRLAALNALAALGDAATVPVLAEAAASRTGTEQAAARQSLVLLRRGDITGALLSQLKAGQPPVQVESARALGERGDPGAIPNLLQSARGGTDSARKAAFQALALLTDQPQAGALVELVVGANNATARAEAVDALNAAFQRIKAKRGQLDAGLYLSALASSPTEAKAALLSISSSLAEPQVRAALRAAVGDPNPVVRTAAIRALCDTIDPELLPDVLRVARTDTDETLRALAIGGCRRLTSLEDGSKLSTKERLDVLQQMHHLRLNAEQKRVVLAGLAEIPELDALKLVEPWLEDGAVRNEAAQAAIKIAPGLAETEIATGVLNKALAASSDPDTRKSAEAALKQVEARADYITAWQVAGPYRQAGKDYAALFDIPFPPEGTNVQAASWKNLPAGSDPKRPWLMDLLKPLGGEQCVAYALTWVHSEQEQPARLEIGADDGVKVWLNQELVHANNVARALQPGSDKVNVTLKAGWNPLLLKITQLNQGWEFCARFVRPDGSHLEGLRFEARH